MWSSELRFQGLKNESKDWYACINCHHKFCVQGLISSHHFPRAQRTGMFPVLPLWQACTTHPSNPHKVNGKKVIFVLISLADILLSLRIYVAIVFCIWYQIVIMHKTLRDAIPEPFEVGRPAAGWDLFGWQHLLELPQLHSVQHAQLHPFQWHVDAAEKSYKKK